MRTSRVLAAAACLGAALLAPHPTLAQLRPRDTLQWEVLQAKRRVLPALVTVIPVQEYFVGGARRKRLVTGSGVIFDPAGHVITNSHVVGQSQKVLCVLSDEREVSATVVGSDPYTDLAVLQLDMEQMAEPRAPYARFGDSDRLDQGDFVLALGTPFGLTRSLSVGVVSTTERVLPPQDGRIGGYNNWIQIDAAINPGNSGGPLVNLDGRIVGINSRGLVGVAENIGFALPGNLAKEIAGRLLEHGRIERATLGIGFQSMESIRWVLGDVGGQAPTGAIIAAVEPGGPGDRAGLRPGDILMAIDGAPVDGRYDEHIAPLRKRISDLPVGAELTLTVQRQRQTLRITATPEPLEGFYAEEFQAAEWGLTVREVTESLRVQQRLDDLSGVHVASAARGKPGFQAGLREDDIIYTFDGEPVKGLEDFKAVYQQSLEERRARILLEVRHGSFYRFVLVKPRYGPKPEAEDKPADAGADETEAPDTPAAPEDPDA